MHSMILETRGSTTNVYRVWQSYLYKISFVQGAQRWPLSTTTQSTNRNVPVNFGNGISEPTAAN